MASRPSFPGFPAEPRRALRGEARVSTATARTIVAPYPGLGRRGLFEADLVRIESKDGQVLAERRNPRTAFRDFRHNLWWDPLDLLHFVGYALWNYLNAPRRTCPPLTRAGLLFRRRGAARRLDYTAEPFGSWATCANYAWQHQTFSGLVVPTRRKVLLRKSWGGPDPWPKLVWIKLDQVTLG